MQKTNKAVQSAKKTSKSDLIRNFLTKNLSTSEIRKKLEKRGFKVYYSEIHRLAH